MLDFQPLELVAGAGFDLQSLTIHIRDHKQRELPILDRSLEAHYGGFVFSQQARADEDAATRSALETSYGRAPLEVWFGGHEARMYEMGPEVEPDDIDGRMPSVVVWSVGNMVYLLASGELSADALVRIAGSLY